MSIIRKKKNAESPEIVGKKSKCGEIEEKNLK